MKQIRAVLFDLDGTIIEFKLRGAEAKQAIIDRFRAQGLKLKKVTSSSSLQTIIDEAAAEMYGVSDSHYEQAWDTAMSVMQRYEEEAFRLAKPRAGMADLIKTLKGMNLKLAVVTNTSQRYTYSWLRRLGVDGALDAIITRQEVRALKPKPDSLRAALERLGSSAEEAVFVGDSIFDYEAAKSIGIKFIGFLGGVHSELLVKDPDILLKARDAKELLHVIEQLIQ